jgi:hypothetical protein
MNAESFFRFINERHRIYLRKRSGENWPWTDDLILQQYKFTNVYRELDAVTIWIRKNIRVPYAKSPALWHMMLTARYINWPDTLTDLIKCGVWYKKDQFDWKAIVKVMQARHNRGFQVWTGAYTVSTNGRAVAKPKYILGHVLQAAWQKRALLVAAAHTSLEMFCRDAQTIDGIGGFMAYEAACDLRYCPGWLDRASDILTWANAGPGAKRGLNRLYDRPLKKGMKNEQAVAEMRHLLALAPLYLESHVPDLEMREIEHCLCEHDKYERVRLGQGAPRSLYHPPQ